MEVAVLSEYALENLDEGRVLDFLGGRVWTAQAKKWDEWDKWVDLWTSAGAYGRLSG